MWSRRCRGADVIVDGGWDERFEAIVRSNVSFLDSGQPLTEDTDLAFNLDSLRMLNLLVMVEEEYGISFPDEKLTIESFTTPGTLWAIIRQLREPSTGGLVAGS